MGPGPPERIGWRGGGGGGGGGGGPGGGSGGGGGRGCLARLFSTECLASPDRAGMMAAQ